MIFIYLLIVSFINYLAAGSKECRLTGIANDYIGTLSITRSGRVCAPWFNYYDYMKLKTNQQNKINILSNKDLRINKNINKNDTKPIYQTIRIREILKKIKNDTVNLTNPKKISQILFKPIHSVDSVYFNDSLYPERSMQNASNYCRNPSQNVAGTWCYTTDPLIPLDLCNIKDCEKREECIYFVQGQEIGRELYILPEYRSEGMRFSLKNWQSNNPNTIIFIFKAENNLNSKYILKIGAANNEKILLYYQSENKDLQLIKKKTLPHVIYLGKWRNFLLRLPHGKIELFYEEASNPLIEWEHPEEEQVFLPIYYNYKSELGHIIGVGFDCTSKCYIENTTTNQFTRILPLSIWNLNDVSNPDGLQLILRAHGTVLLSFMILPGNLEFYGLNFNKSNSSIYFLKNSYSRIKIFHKQKLNRLLYNAYTWTNITIKWMNYTILIYCNDTIVFNYEHEYPLLFYFFSLTVDTGGWAIWAANCVPTTIDGDPQDGSWSEWGPWTYTGSCISGLRTRKRICNSPKPNIKGEPCLGPNLITNPYNSISCGDITESTFKTIQHRIRMNYTSLNVKEGNKIIIFADVELINIIVKESPRAIIKWSQNGIYVDEDLKKNEIIDYNIILKKSKQEDSGIYTLTLHRINGMYLTLKVVSLAVVPLNPSIIIHETLPLFLTCHCTVLGYVYKDLNIQWNINKTVWKDYGTTSAAIANNDLIYGINLTHNGLWKCLVKQNDLNFEWTTNIILIKVVGPPNLWMTLIQDILIDSIFYWITTKKMVTTVVLYFIILICIIICTKKFLNKKP